MPSPFPGMNPYLEHDDAWHNFHEQFPGAVVEMLVPQVGPNYYVKVDERIYIHELPDGPSRFQGRADVALARRPESVPLPGPTAGVRTRPREITLPVVDRHHLSYVEIRDRRNRRLVTVMELLSPSNKMPGPDREQYEAKRAEILSTHTHFVEIDLLRGWQRMPFEEDVQGDYCVLVSRYEKRPKADLWQIRLRERLPVIPVPLAEKEAEPQLDLQELLNRLYDRGGYGNFIYASQPEPPLSAEDAVWAETMIQGLRNGAG